MNEYIIIANGPDRIGIVSDFSKILTDNGGNIKESRMTKLAGDFAIIMLIEIASSKTEIENYLSKLNLIISIKNATKISAKSKNVRRPKKIFLKGADNEGLVFSLTDFLSKHDININNLTTEIVQAPITGINLFSMEAIINIPENISNDFLKEKIDFLKNTLEVDIELFDI